SHTHTHTHSFSLSHTHTLTHSLSHTHTHSHTLSHTHTCADRHITKLPSQSKKPITVFDIVFTDPETCVNGMKGATKRIERKGGVGVCLLDATWDNATDGMQMKTLPQQVSIIQRT